MTEAACPFCHPPAERIVHAGNCVLGIWDAFPAAPGHALLIPNLNAISMIPMGSVAGTASAVIGTVATLGGSLIGLTIDRAYNGTLVPFGVAAAITGIVAFALMTWADRNYDASVDETAGGPEPSRSAFDTRRW